MTREELTPAQEGAIVGLETALAGFALALEGCRDAELSVIDSFRLAGIEIPSFVPASLLENLLAPAA